MKPAVLFLIMRDNGKPAGPYDLVQMAALLRKNIISADTSVCLEGKEIWKPFGHYPQFMVAREMPVNATSMQLDSLDAKMEGMGTIIPLPSMATVGKLLATAALFAIVATIVFFISSTNQSVGMVLGFAGGGIALAAQVLMVARLLDEGILTILMVAVVPFYDLFYFITNLETYFPYFVAKYFGIVVALASVIGLAVAQANGVG